MSPNFFAEARARVREQRQRIYDAYQQDSDPWFGVDKIEHFAACLAITLLTYALLAGVRTFRSPRVHDGVVSTIPFALALCTSVLAGLAKELGDASQLWPWCPPCVPSHRDLAANVLGSMVGAAVLILCGLFSRVQNRLRGYAVAAGTLPS